MIEITSKYSFEFDSRDHNEDTWFCINHKDEVKVCDLRTACNFSMETITNKYDWISKSRPMGLHDHATYAFLENRLTFNI